MPGRGRAGVGTDHGGVMRILVAFNRAAGSSAAGEAMAEVLAGRPGVTLRYLRDAAGLLGDLQSYLGEITLDDLPPLAVDALNVIVANGRFAAHGWPVASQASLEDGLLDVVIVRNGDLFDLTEVAAHLVAGD